MKNNLRYILQAGGGTETHRALEATLDFIKQAEFTESRIVLLHDGDDSVDPNILRKKMRELKTKLHAILIGGHSFTLEELAEQYDRLQ